VECVMYDDNDDDDVGVMMMEIYAGRKKER
jgi:hypothetical protein